MLSIFNLLNYAFFLVFIRFNNLSDINLNSNCSRGNRSINPIVINIIVVDRCAKFKKLKSSVPLNNEVPIISDKSKKAIVPDTNIEVNTLKRYLLNGSARRSITNIEL